MNKVKRIKELTCQLNHYRDLYYNNSLSEISDLEYDNLFDELKKLEVETNIVMANSPTHTVGYELKSKLEKVKHSHPMLSLDKTKSVDDLVKFSNGKECLLMCKMDGLTVLLTYENGELIQAETRGNGEEGEIITHNARVFENIPLHINYTGHLEIEGEAIITYEDFEKINSKLPENEKYKNPRNLVSGSVRQLDSNIAAQRHIRFIVWKIPTEDELILAGFQDARELGFEIVPYVFIKGWENHYDEYIEYLKDAAKEKGFPIDGLVMAYNDIAYGKSLGNTGHHPKHSIAYKFYDEEVTTVLKDIEWSMGKTGELTPVAIFNEVELEGTTVSRASLHNISICKELQLGIGDEVTVYKANQIIPQLRDNFTKSNNLVIPNVCPICGGNTEIVKDNNTEVLICTNSDCKGKLLGKLSHFCSKNAINIDGLSEQTLQKFIELGWLNSFRDIYCLSDHKDEMYKLDGFGKKSVDKLIENIGKSRNTTLDRFVYGLCIPLIGKTASKEIRRYFSTINSQFDGYVEFMNFIENSIEEYGFVDLGFLNDFGEKMSESVTEFFKYNMNEVDELAKEFIFGDRSNANVDEKFLSGKTFVITGSLNHYKNRDELVSVIEEFGGKVSGSVSAKTSYLITNDIQSNSSKNKKAHDLGIPIINEENFIKIVQSSI